MERVLVWLTGRYARGAALDAGAALGRAAGDGRGRRRRACGCSQGAKSELAPLEDRGVILMHRPRAGRRDAGIHGALPAMRSSASARATPNSTGVFIVIGNPTGVAGRVGVLRTVDWSERKRTTLEMARDLQPEFARAAGRVGVPDHAARPGAGLPRAAGQLRHRQRPTATTNMARVAQQMLAEMSKQPGHRAARQRPAAEQAARSSSTSIVTVRPMPASPWTRWRAPSRPCSAGAT